MSRLRGLSRRCGWNRNLAGFNFGQEAGFGTVFGKGNYVTVPQIDVGDAFPIDISAIGAGVDNAKSVSLAFDPGVFPGDGRQLFFESDLTCGMAADQNGELEEILDLPFQRALDMNQLYRYVGHLGHGVPPACCGSGIDV